MKPSGALRENYAEVMAVFARWPLISNVRVFGSVAEGDDRETSDLNLLVDAADGTSYYDLAEIELVLENLLRCRVEVTTRTKGKFAEFWPPFEAHIVAIEEWIERPGAGTP
ncbi:nucleotidyltransferase family protein [Bradyrhizobium sp.]